MRTVIISVMLLVRTAVTGSVEIGENELPSNNPFCGDCAASMRYQTLYLEAEEMNKMLSGLINSLK